MLCITVCILYLHTYLLVAWLDCSDAHYANRRLNKSFFFCRTVCKGSL